MPNRLRYLRTVFMSFWFAGLCMTAAVAAAANDGGGDVFDASTIRDIWIEIPGLSWTSIDDEALTACEPHNRSYYPGMIRIGTADFPGSGVRIKGGCGSSRTLEDKAAFKANLAWNDPNVPGCPQERTYGGLKKFTFNNQVEDASFTHERIGYDFFQKLGVPVPRVAPVQVHVNKQLWGLYLNIETIDRLFLARHFDNSEGMLYEADYGCDIGEESCFEPKFDTDECDQPPAGDPTDMTPLQGLNARLAQIPDGEFYPAITQIIDFDTYLKMWAAAVVMGYWDGYPNDANNYRIYHNPSDDRWTAIPTGIDQLFENNVDPFNPTGLLSIRCLAEVACKTAFRQILSDVIDRFEASDYPTMARKIERQIDQAVTVDPRKEVSVTEWHAAVNDTIAYMRRRPGELRELLASPETKMPEKDFYSHVFTDPNGVSFVFVTWIASASGTEAQQKWLTAKGNFSGLSAQANAYESTGSSPAGKKVGTVTIDFEDCTTAEFQFAPDDDSLVAQSRMMPVDPSTWKYCE